MLFVAPFVLLFARFVWVIISLNVETYAQQNGYDRVLSDKVPHLVRWMFNNIQELMLATTFLGGAVVYIALASLVETLFPAKKQSSTHRGHLGLKIDDVGVSIINDARTMVHTHLSIWSKGETDLFLIDLSFSLTTDSGEFVGKKSLQIHSRAVLSNIIHDDLSYWTTGTAITTIPHQFLFTHYFDTVINQPKLIFHIEATDSKGKKHKYRQEFMAVLRK